MSNDSVGGDVGGGDVDDREGRVRAVRAGIAAQAAGVIWMLQWSHSLVAHGPTQRDRLGVWLGMTWFDSGKFLVVAFLLLIPAVLLIARRAREAGSPAAGWLGVVVASVLAAAALTTAAQFGPFEWGSYVSRWPAVSHHAGWLQAVTSSLLLTVVLVALGVAAARARAMPWWLVPVLAVGTIATVFLAGPLPPVPGLVWLILGGWVLVQAGRSPPTFPSTPARQDLAEVV